MKSKKSNKVHACRFSDHAKKIADGEGDVLRGWLDAARECRDFYSGNASEYARAAVKVSDTHSSDTVRNYVGACLKAMKEWGNDYHDVRKGMEFVLGFAYASVEDLRNHFRKKSTRKVTASRKEKTVSVSSRKVRGACKKAGLSDKKTQELVELLGL